VIDNAPAFIRIHQTPNQFVCILEPFSHLSEIVTLWAHIDLTIKPGKCHYVHFSVNTYIYQIQHLRCPYPPSSITRAISPSRHVIPPQRLAPCRESASLLNSFTTAYHQLSLPLPHRFRPPVWVDELTANVSGLAPASIIPTQIDNVCLSNPCRQFILNL